MTCPHSIRYIPAITAFTQGVKIDKRSRFGLQDANGNIYLFRVNTKKDHEALKEIEDYFNSQVDNQEYICKLGRKDGNLALLYLIKTAYTSNKKEKLTIHRRKVKNFFDYDLLV